MPYYKFVSRANLNSYLLPVRRAHGSSRNSNFEAEVLEIEICCAFFDIRFVISIFELTKRPGPVKKFHGEVRDGYL